MAAVWGQSPRPLLPFAALQGLCRSLSAPQQMQEAVNNIFLEEKVQACCLVVAKQCSVTFVLRKDLQDYVLFFSCPEIINLMQ